jgi:WD40 repeat protein
MLWHRSGSHLFGIAPFDSENVDPSQPGGSSIIRWDIAGLPGIAEPSTVLVPEILLDMDSAFFDGNGIVCAAGQNAVYCCRTYPELGVEQKWSSDPIVNDQWTFVRCGWRGGTNATLVSASAETSTIWLPAQNLFKRGAHDAPITGLELRPRLSSTFVSTWKMEFATSSMDGTLKVWRYDEHNSSIISVCKVIIGHGSPIMALAYSPDGFCLAGASYDTVRIWNAEHGHSHMATWKEEQNSWNGLKLKDDDMMSLGGRSSMNGDASQPSADHTLMWDGDSKKLAFGLGSQVRVVTASYRTLPI